MNDMYPPFVLKSQKLEKSGKLFIHTESEIIIPDLKLFSTTYTSRLTILLSFTGCKLLIPCLKSKNDRWSQKKCSSRIRIYYTRFEVIYCPLTIQGIINTGSLTLRKLLSWKIPPLLSELVWARSKIWKWSWLTDWFRKNKKLRVWISLKG